MLSLFLLCAALAAEPGPPPPDTAVVRLRPTTSELVQSEVALPGRAFVGSRRFPDDLGGFGSSDNRPVPLDPSAEAGRVWLELTPAAGRVGDRAGVVVRLANTSGAPLVLRAQDSRIDLVQQAWVDGQWRTIEHLPHSFCGNSMHRVELPDGHAWILHLPRYGGPHAVWLRARLETPAGVLTTAAYAGGLSDGQLGLERGHKSPASLMDPVGW